MLPGRWFGTFREHCLANEGQKHIAAHSFGARDVCIETHTSYTWELREERVCGVIEWILRTCLRGSVVCVLAWPSPTPQWARGLLVFFGLLCVCPPSFRQTKQEIGGCDRLPVQPVVAARCINGLKPRLTCPRRLRTRPSTLHRHTHTTTHHPPYPWRPTGGGPSAGRTGGLLRRRSMRDRNRTPPRAQSCRQFPSPPPSHRYHLSLGPSRVVCLSRQGAISD